MDLCQRLECADAPSTTLGKCVFARSIYARGGEGAVGKLKLGDTQVRQTLIEHNLRLVVYIARKFENTGVGIEDLVSIGTIGLIKAVNTFDPSKNIKLATYGSRCIENEILMYLRRNSRLKSEVSFDEPLNTDWDGNELLLSDVLGTEPDLVSRGIENHTEREMLSEALESLPPREKHIMALRYGPCGRPEMTQREVAELMGISQSYISRLEKRIILRLRGRWLRWSSARRVVLQDRDSQVTRGNLCRC